MKVKRRGRFVDEGALDILKSNLRHAELCLKNIARRAEEDLDYVNEDDANGGLATVRACINTVNSIGGKTDG